MLQTQVNYWTLQENVRSHLANEAILRFQNEETQRHNLTSEQLGFDTLRENTRHNVATESLGFANYNLEQEKLSETHRANRVKEKQYQTSLRQENKRIQETRKHNRAMEQISKISNDIGYLNASTSRYSAETGRLGIGVEQQRLSETARHNERSEYLSAFQNALDLRKVLETGRHNKATESTNQYGAETGRKSYEWNVEQYTKYGLPLDITDRVLKGMDIGARAAGTALGFVGKSYRD